LKCRDCYTIHMETSELASTDEQDADEVQATVHYSTGRLTRAQAELVNKWRARLLEDRPLPGARPAGGIARLVGFDDRPRASCSDVIAAAVTELLRQAAPGELDLARYAHAAWHAQRAAGRGQGDDDRAPRYPPVSFYLPAELAVEYEALRLRAAERVLEVHRELGEEAVRRYPDEQQARERAGWITAELARLGVPWRLSKVPGGALARMAIDRWARRSADRVAGDAAAYSADAHEQPHRGRRDMHELRR